MRILSFAFLLLIFSCESFDTNTNLETEFVPAKLESGVELEDHVDVALKKMYPKIGKYKILIKQKTCVVDFIMGGNIYQVKFDLDGNWQNSEVIVAYEFTLPDGVKKYLESPEFDGWTLTEKKLIEKPEDIRYKFVFKKRKEIKSVWVDRNGDVMRDKTDTRDLIN